MTEVEKTELSGGGPVTDDHREINPATGMQKGYVVLSPEERAKGFLRPVRRSYLHIGIAGPKHPLRDLTEYEVDKYGARFGYVKYEAYPDAKVSAVVGKFWTRAELDSVGKACQAVTTMSTDLAETYARKPHFYSGTFCATCREHRPVNEFVWDGTDERVGS